MKWEENVVTKTCKTLAITSFIVWRMEQKKHLLERKQSFQNLTSYPDSVNQVESLADFVGEVSRDILMYFQSLETADAVCVEEIHDVSDTEVTIL